MESALKRTKNAMLIIMSRDATWSGVKKMDCGLATTRMRYSSSSMKFRPLEYSSFRTCTATAVISRKAAARTLDRVDCEKTDVVSNNDPK